MARLHAVMALALIAAACANDGADSGAIDPVTDRSTSATDEGGTMPDPTDPTSAIDPTAPTRSPDDGAPDEPTTATTPAPASGEPTTTPTNAPGVPDDEAPSPTAPTGDADRTEGTLELDPPKASPPTTATEPTGGDDSLYPGQIDPGLAPFVDLAVADLAARLGVAGDDITTISATLVSWSDASLGCPAPGMVYAQVLQDGSLIELGHAGKVYRYHSGGDRTPFLCDAALAAPPAKGGPADD